MWCKKTHRRPLREQPERKAVFFVELTAVDRWIPVAISHGFELYQYALMRFDY